MPALMFICQNLFENFRGDFSPSPFKKLQPQIIKGRVLRRDGLISPPPPINTPCRCCFFRLQEIIYWTDKVQVGHDNDILKTSFKLSPGLESVDIISML